MPTISQLPSVSEVTPADALPLSQQGATRSVSVGALLASMQPAIMADQGTLLGRVSLGAGGPEPIAIGAGLLLNDGTLAATASGSPDDYDIASMPSVTTIAGGDLVAISQAGTNHAISYARLLDGLTIDLAQPALPATDSDMLWVAQGNSTMLRQTLSAIWSWLMSKLPSYRLPVVEITANTTLDGTVHNGRILICRQPVTLTPAPINMGSGFHCDVLNLSAGIVTLGAGITTSSGTAELRAGQSATLRVASYSGGTVVFASMTEGAGGAVPAGAVVSVTWNMAPSGSYAHGDGYIGVNARINPGNAAVQFGFCTSATVPPSSWTAGTHVDADIWAAYVATPATAGTWYAWVEGTDGSHPTVYETPFTVT